MGSVQLARGHVCVDTSCDSPRCWFCCLARHPGVGRGSRDVHRRSGYLAKKLTRGLKDECRAKTPNSVEHLGDAQMDPTPGTNHWDGAAWARDEGKWRCDASIPKYTLA